MTTATPLSLPFVLKQSDRSSSSQTSRRRWKPDRPNYRALLTAAHSTTASDAATTSASSRSQSTTKPTSSQIDLDQLEADLNEWGVPSAHASSTTHASRLAAPVSAISWDENSAQSSCAQLRNDLTASSSLASLDRWDPSVSFAPFASSSLKPVALSAEGETARTFKYHPSLGRILAVGREDGTITVYRAYGRTEDYDSLMAPDQLNGEPDDSFPASASASANLSHSSMSASRRSSVISNTSRLRSPEQEAPSIRLTPMNKTPSSTGREPSPLLSSFSHADRASLAARSTISAASVSSNVASNVQLDEALPIGSVQSNVTATGSTAGRHYLDQAENRLELQMAAAERNDHQHGAVGNVIERLGLSSHSPSPHHQASSSLSQSRGSYHRAKSGDSRQSPVASPRSEQPSDQTKQQQKPDAATGAVTEATLLRSSTSDAWLHDPSRGSFCAIMTLFTRDRSPVVALRLVPLPSADDDSQGDVDSTQPTLDRSALLVVQEAGNITLWSVREGAMLWQADVTTAQVAPIAAAQEQASKDASLSFGVMQSLSRQLPASLGTPLNLSPAGSARASPRPTVTGGDAVLRRSMLRSALSAPDSASTSGRLREAHGVKLDSSTQTLHVFGHPIALVWDSHSSTVLMLDLVDGRLLLHEPIDDVHSASAPTARRVAGSPDRLELVWFNETEGKLSTRPLLVVTSGSTTGQTAAEGTAPPVKLQGITCIEQNKSEQKHLQTWLLPGPASRIYHTSDHVVVLSEGKISVHRSADGQVHFLQEAIADTPKSIFGSSRDLQQLLIQTSTGTARLSLATEKISHVEQQDTNQSSKRSRSQASLANVSTVLPSSRLRLCWNQPQSGALLDKIFLVQPLTASVSGAQPAECSSQQNELVAWHLTDGQSEDLLTLPSSTSDRKDPPSTNRIEGDDQSDRITAVLPLSLERVVVAKSGGLSIHSLLTLSAGAAPLTQSKTDSTNSLGEADICILRSAVAPRSSTRLAVGGTLQGEVGFWDVSAGTGHGTASAGIPKLEAALSVSTTPVEALVVFGDEDNTLRLHGCVACICADSSVTVILLEGFRKLYTVPGRGARLTSLAVRADELLLTYDDDKARVWDLRSQELRRSIATDQAQALVEDGKGWWTVKPIEPYSPLRSGTTGVLSQLAAARDDAGAALLVDFRRAIEAAARSVRGSGQPSGAEASSNQHSGQARAVIGSIHPLATTKADQDNDRGSGPASVSLGSPAARKAVNIVRPLLPTVFPVGLDAHVDEKLAALLDLEESVEGHRKHALTVGLHSAPDALMIGSCDADSCKQVWKLSSRLTTMMMLIASALLRVLINVDELRGLSEELLRFVEDEVQMSSLVGVGFRSVTLEELIPYWLDSNVELQAASRTIFQGALARLEQDQLDAICSHWQGLLVPAKASTQAAKSNRVDSHASSGDSTGAELRTRAVALLGSMAVQRYTCFSPRLLKDIAITIHDAIVSDRGSEMRTPQELQMLCVAIDLCCSGFSMWQHYFDATEVVRSLFALSTSTASGNNADGDLRSLARSATLQIAAENTPLFMTTLSLDILHARTAAHCAATMRLVAFMVRKRPSVLVANLPRLAEAVVKSLDPTHTTMREAVVNAATVMISELVSTYPNVSFFGGGQRLAVGTHEGAVIMYDLKTATRLYVLEGHRRRADAVSFSPDGRRLVTMSLKEGRVLVWKTSSGLSSFFSPGQMPRQGATDPKLTDGAYKAFLFNVGDHTVLRPGNVAGAQSGPFDGTGQEEEFVGFDKIGFLWNSERSVKVQIGEAQLNISVD